MPLFPFCTPENIRKPGLFYVFRGYRNGTLALHGLVLHVVPNVFRVNDKGTKMMLVTSQRKGASKVSLEGNFEKEIW